MAIPILRTKLYIPLLRVKIVSRPQLIARLTEGMKNKLTLISAPAGFGKTTLVSEWVAGCKRPVTWLSLDDKDNNLIQFISYFVAALKSIQEDFGEGVIEALPSLQSEGIESILTDLINEITEVPFNFVFVLDDYHVIDNVSVNNALVFLIDHMPVNLNLIITTRVDPDLHIAKLRAKNQLLEIRAKDLRFTHSEVARFFDQVMGLKLSDKDLTTLETRTEGWIAGLQLAAISLQGQSDMSGFIESFSGNHYFILDYLIEEVLKQQSEEIQSFLLQTSIVDRLCGSLCDAIMNQSSPSGQETLEYLQLVNLFIVPLDNERRWYRYHHLFADLLRQRLYQSASSGNQVGCLAGYNIRASRWYEENGDLGAAFHHAIAAEDFVQAARLVEAAWQGMNESFQSVAWLGWVKKLPEEVIRIRPVLCTYLGRAFADAGELEASELCLQDAERCLDGSDGANEAQQLKALPAMIALVRANNAQMQGDLASTVKYAELALQLIPKDDFARRAQAIITLEVTHWASGDLESAIRAIGDWMESMTQLGNHVFVVASAFALADMLIDLGRLSEAKKTYQDALQLAAQHGPDAEHITAHHHLGLSMIYRQRGDHAFAANHLTRAAELGLQTTLVDWLHRWHVVQAQLKEAAGDLEAALTLLDEAKRVYIRSGVPDLRPIAALKARIYLKQRRPDKTRAWAKERALSLTDEVNYLSEFEYLTLARLEIANPLVNALLARLLQAAETQKRLGSVLDILLVQSLAYEAQSDHLHALAALKRALSLAEPEGYIRIFVDEGEPMRQLIEKQSRNQDHLQSDYVDKLLAAFTQPQDVPKSAIIHQKPNMIEPLSERELEVLKLLRTELSGPEIASRLFVSLNTFRTHTKNIFNKLGVNNRRMAVHQAKELDLF